MNNIREIVLKEAKNYLTNMEGHTCASFCLKIQIAYKGNFILLYSMNKKNFQRGFMITTSGIYIKSPKGEKFISFNSLMNVNIYKTHYHIYIGKTDLKLFVANNDVDKVFSFLKKLRQYNFFSNSTNMKIEQKVSNNENKKLLLDIQKRQQKIEEELNFVKMLAENIEKLHSTLN